MNECGCEIAAIVVEYYLTYLSRLRQAIPYDTMGSQISILIMSLQEFSRKDIAEKICAWKEVNLLERVDELKHEIQKFKIVQLDPKGILLYMDILRGEVAV